MNNHPERFSLKNSFFLTSVMEKRIIKSNVTEGENMGKFEKKPQKRKNKKGLIIVLSVLVFLLAAIVSVFAWTAIRYHIVDAKLYAKDLVSLDLRGQEIRVNHYRKLAEKMPDCDIRWDIPFQNGILADDAREVTVTSLTAKDVERLDYAEKLEVVHAEDCRDYDALAQLRHRRPELDVRYNVAFSAGNFSWNLDTLLLDRVTEEDIQLLQYLPNLKTVALEAGSYDRNTVETLRGTVLNAGQKFGVVIGGKIIQDTETALVISDITEESLGLLDYLPVLKQLKLENPNISSERLEELRNRYPQVKISLQVSIEDVILDETTTEVDLTMVKITDLAEVERNLACLPELETVTFGLCGMDEPKWGNSRSKLTASPIENEDLAAYRDRVREAYKVVWTVRLGPSIALRTDADNFMPNHFGVGQLPDSYAYNLRYCEDMVCLDVGHMTLTDISFVEYMPKLKYLILAWTEVKYIEPIRSCKNLVFLELDNSTIRDLSPLVDCTALEDLNLGNTFCDVTPILEMTWLKNVYFILGSPASAYKVSQAIPTAHVVATGTATVGGGWRRLPNYYDMRDCLNMPYMN